jgi:DNA-binding MarR family transcriptional regulator
MDSSSTGFVPYEPLPKTQWRLIQRGTLAMHWIKQADRHISRRFEVMLKMYELIDSEWQALRELYKPERTSPRDLARAIGMSKGGTSKLINRLVRAGYVQKEVDPFDRRRRVLELTEEGERVVPELASDESATDQKCFRRLWGRRQASLVRSLKRMLVPRQPWKRFDMCFVKRRGRYWGEY